MKRKFLRLNREGLCLHSDTMCKQFMEKENVKCPSGPGCQYHEIREGISWCKPHHELSHSILCKERPCSYKIDGIYPIVGCLWCQYHFVEIGDVEEKWLRSNDAEQLMYHTPKDSAQHKCWLCDRVFKREELLPQPMEFPIWCPIEDIEETTTLQEWLHENNKYAKRKGWRSVVD